MPLTGLRVTFLGTGTSVGIPVITCRCDVCTSTDPRNQRLRASLMLEWDTPSGDARVVIDTSTDFRQQALRAAIDRLDAVVYTHAHADHVLGLDELRIFNFVQRRPMPLYGNADTLAGIRRMFAYAFAAAAVGVPSLELHEVGSDFALLQLRWHAIDVEHGPGQVQAFRIGDFAYVTDCNGISPQAEARLQGLDTLVIDALRRKPHRSHFGLQQALAQIELLRPRRALLTHLSHDLEHEAISRELPSGVGIAHDGMVLELPLPDECRCT